MAYVRRRARALVLALVAIPAYGAASAAHAQAGTEPAGPTVTATPTDTTPRADSTPRVDSTQRAATGAQVKPPPARLSLLFNREASVVVVTDTQRATNLRILQSTLQEGTTGAQLPPSSLKLCVAGRCDGAINLGPRTATRVELVVDPAFRHKGTFTGSVFLASNENPAGMVPVELTVLSTTPRARAAGGALLLAGILVGVLATVFLRHRALRLQALLPAKRLQGLIDRLEREVKAAVQPTDAPFRQTLARLEALRLELSSDNLEGLGYVPSRLAAAVPATDRASEYGELLKRIAGEVGAVEVVLVRGIRPVMELWTAHPGHEALMTALRQLDRAGAQSATKDAAQEAAEKIRAAAEAAVGVGGGAESLAGAEAVTLPDVHAVQVAFQRTNAAIWLLWALVTWVTGIVALVATNYAFGAGLDYYKCFLWGIGVQVAGNQLQQLTPASVSTAFSISTQKT